MLFRSNDTATTEIYTDMHTLSLHDALPIRTDTVIRDALPGIVRPMVIGGSVSRSSAKISGEAAGLCLRELQVTASR